MKISKYSTVLVTVIVLAGFSVRFGCAYAQTGSTYNIPTADLKNQPWSVQQAAQRWDVPDGEITQLLRHFFGLEGGIYTDDLAKGFRKTPAGLPSVFDQAEMMYLPINERMLPNGDRLLISAMQHATYSRRYLVLQGTLADLQVAAAALTYYYAPPSGHLVQHGLLQGTRVPLEGLPSLVIFYPEDSSGHVVRDPYLESIITDEVESFFRGYFAVASTSDSEARDALNSESSLLERVTIKGVKVRTTKKDMMP